MIRSFIRYLKGYVKIRAEGFSPERFLNMCSYHQIFIWGMKPCGNGYEMCMSIRDFRRLKPLAKKTHTRIVLSGRYGFPFFLFRYRKRRAFFIGAFLCVVLIKTYSLFIWDIHFEGNSRWPDETLSEYLRSEGVSPLMLKSRVDCPGIVKNIRKEYNDIVWVSASIDGSRLKIQIKENEDTFPQENVDVSGEETPTDLIASSDGVITSIVTRSGVPQVHVGDRVKKGDLLVLGRVDVVDDSGEVTGYQYQRSDADIFADTTMEYRDEISLTYKEKVYDGKEKYLPYVRFRDYTISVGSLANKYDHSEVISKEQPLKAGENFYLPVSLGLKTAKSYAFEEKKYSEEEVRALLSRNFERFYDDLAEKGVQIKGNNVKIHLYADSAVASGTLNMNERITEEADTEILTIERKETDESVGTDD
ncbi:MAG TPA: sporulation protein YqfD [Candidatus Mediterraneibacter pullistercoris]|nr:sporulation protein YqfD [Candidatus Mediterraneibacter pullistercoris]